MSEAGGEPDVISTKADIDTHAAWLADRNWPTLSRIGPHRRRAGAAVVPVVYDFDRPLVLSV